MSTGLRALLSLAWPIVLARSAQAVIGFCDALMTAPLGESAVAAVTTGAMNAFSATIFPMGVVFIVQSFAAQLSAKGELDAARRYAWYGLSLAAAAGALAVAAIPLIEPLLGLLAYAPEVHRHMTDYLEIRAFSVGALVAIEAVGNWYGGLGNTRVHMVAGIVTMAVNIVLNWVLIYGNLGAPALGVEGAAAASVLASWIGLAVLSVPFAAGWFTQGQGGRSARGGSLGLRASELWRMLRFGLPNGFNWFLEFAALTLFINVIVARLGTTTLAALMIVFNINSVSFMPAFGIASSGAILTGQAIGSDERDRVPQIVRLTMAVAATWQGVVGLIYLLAPETLMGLFAQGESTARLIEIGAVLLAISAAWQLFDAVAMTYGETLRAAGDTAWAMWARVVVAWLLFVPASYLSVWTFGGGHVAAMICIVGYLASLALLFGWRFRSGAWRDIDLTGEEEQLLAGPAG